MQGSNEPHAQQDPVFGCIVDHDKLSCLVRADFTGLRRNTRGTRYLNMHTWVLGELMSRMISGRCSGLNQDMFFFEQTASREALNSLQLYRDAGSSSEDLCVQSMPFMNEDQGHRMDRNCFRFPSAWELRAWPCKSLVSELEASICAANQTCICRDMSNRSV